MNDIDGILDEIYNKIDEMLLNDNFNECNLLLQSLTIPELSIDEMLGYLTITLPAKNKLQYRSKFYMQVEKNLKKRGEYDIGLLHRLQ